MKRALNVAAALLMVGALGARANSPTADGGTPPPTHSYSIWGDRLGLIEEGSFEDGACAIGSAWTCTADNDCSWVVDLTDLGYSNFSGTQSAWLGGYCRGIATCGSSFCQDLYIDGPYLTWYWMASVNDAVATVNVTVDGNVVFSYQADFADNDVDYRYAHADISAYEGESHTVCFEYENSADCAANLGDNYFFDFVQLRPDTPAESVSFSTVKSLY